ncbi:MAG: hypothetical protein ACK4M7_04855, partial [Burkholderiales bacterium]
SILSTKGCTLSDYGYEEKGDFERDYSNERLVGYLQGYIVTPTANPIVYGMQGAISTIHATLFAKLVSEQDLTVEEWVCILKEAPEVMSQVRLYANRLLAPTLSSYFLQAFVSPIKASDIDHFKQVRLNDIHKRFHKFRVAIHEIMREITTYPK